MLNISTIVFNKIILEAKLKTAKTIVIEVFSVICLNIYITYNKNYYYCIDNLCLLFELMKIYCFIYAQMWSLRLKNLEHNKNCFKQDRTTQSILIVKTLN